MTFPSLTASFAGTKILYELRVAPASNLVRVKDSIEAYGMSRITYNQGGHATTKDLGVPDVWRINPLDSKHKIGTLMTREFQLWIYRILVEWEYGWFANDKAFNDFYKSELYKYKHKTGGGTIKDFSSLFRTNASHTNFAGVDKNANFIADERTDAGLPIFSNIVTGRWVGESAGGLNVKVINASKGFLQYNPFDNPTLFDQPLITGRVFVGDTNIILRDDIRRPYGQFSNRSIMPVMLPEDDIAYFPDAKLFIPSDEDPLRKF